MVATRIARSRGRTTGSKTVAYALACPLCEISAVCAYAQFLHRRRDWHAGSATGYDATFWDAGLQVELMRLLVARWTEISAGDREAIEQRWCVGVPRNLYVDDAFSSEEEWEFHLDSHRFRRLSRLDEAGHSVRPASMRMLSATRERRGWESYTDDQADFAAWTESRMGPQGNPELLADVRDSELLAEVRQLRESDPFEQGGIWEIICAREPTRAHCRRWKLHQGQKSGLDGHGVASFR